MNYKILQEYKTKVYDVNPGDVVRINGDLLLIINGSDYLENIKVENNTMMVRLTDNKMTVMYNDEPIQERYVAALELGDMSEQISIHKLYAGNIFEYNEKYFIIVNSSHHMYDWLVNIQTGDFQHKTETDFRVTYYPNAYMEIRNII